MESISIQYSSWFIIFCLLLGAGYAAFHYYRNSEFDQTPWLRPALSLLRGAVVAFIAILLLEPALRSLEEEVNPPLVLIGIDQSKSIEEAYSDQDIEVLKKQLQGLTETLSDKYETSVVSIATNVNDSLSKSFDGAKTNLSSFFDHIDDNYAHLNVGGVILISDGLYNEGKNVLYQNVQFNAPVHTVTLGDTTVDTDINIRNIFHNQIAFLDDRFEIEVDLEAKNCQGQRHEVSLQYYVNGRWASIDKKEVEISKKDQFTTLTFELEAKTVGVQRYRVKATSGKNESNNQNNSREFFIEILDARQKIVIVKNAPHPDISALKKIIESNQNYEVEVADVSEAPSALTQADLVIFHNLPSRKQSITSLLSAMNNNKTPRLFIAGSQIHGSAFNAVQSSVAVTDANGSLNEVQAIFDQSFTLFGVENETTKQLRDYPPLNSPFGQWTVEGGAQVMARQKIGSISTDYPLLAFSDRNGLKEGVLLGEGIWKWRVVNYVKQGEHEMVDALTRKVIQYLSVRENKEQFRVRSNRNLYEEGESVFFNAELYNDAFDAITDPEVELTITSATGEAFNYTFSRNNDRYNLDAGQLKAGDYQYAAKSQLNGKPLTKRGNFAVKTIEVEYYNTVADHQLLRSLSDRFGGLSVGLEGLDSLTNHLLDSDIKPRVTYANKTKPIIHFKWLFGMIALLLSLEWFLRRYYGRY